MANVAISDVVLGTLHYAEELEHPWVLESLVHLVPLLLQEREQEELGLQFFDNLYPYSSEVQSKLDTACDCSLVSARMNARGNPLYEMQYELTPEGTAYFNESPSERLGDLGPRLASLVGDALQADHWELVKMARALLDAE